jgi:transcriptional regulator with XRE-family HTH domain
VNVTPRVPRKIPREFWAIPGVRLALATHDIATVFRLLRRHVGLTQRELAVLVGCSQSEVSEILSGRAVQAHSVLSRIGRGLRVPPGWLGVAFDRSTMRLLRELAPSKTRPGAMTRGDHG